MKRPNVTPGPRTIQFSTSHGEDSQVIADGEVLAVVCSRGDMHEQHANARAIAAAPDLLDALELAHAANSNNFMQMKFAVQAALIKAGYTF